MTSTPEHRIVPGTTLTLPVEVTEALTVGYTVPGMPFVYSTPWMIHHMEVVSAAAVRPFLSDGTVTVGTRVDVRHLAAAPVGTTVLTTSTVVDVTGDAIRFEVTARDADETIGRGHHTRALVDMARFERGLARKRADVR